MKNFILVLSVFLLSIYFVPQSHAQDSPLETRSQHKESIEYDFTPIDKQTRVKGLVVLSKNRVKAARGYRFRQIRPQQIGRTSGRFFVLEKPGQRATGTFHCTCKGDGQGSCTLETNGSYLLCSGGSCSGCELQITLEVPGD